MVTLERRLSAVLAADVTGYRRLMGLDEGRTAAQSLTPKRPLPSGDGGFVQRVVRAPEPGRGLWRQLLLGNHARVCHLSRD